MCIRPAWPLFDRTINSAMPLNALRRSAWNGSSVAALPLSTAAIVPAPVTLKCTRLSPGGHTKITVAIFSSPRDEREIVAIGEYRCMVRSEFHPRRRACRAYFIHHRLFPVPISHSLEIARLIGNLPFQAVLTKELSIGAHVRPNRQFHRLGKALLASQRLTV